MTVVCILHTPVIDLVPSSVGWTARETFYTRQNALNLLKDTTENKHAHSERNLNVLKKIFETLLNQNACQTALVLTQYPLVVQEDFWDCRDHLFNLVFWLPKI